MPELRDNIPLGISVIIGTVLLLSFGDAVIKSLGGQGTMGMWQFLAIRSGLALPVLVTGAVIFVRRTVLRPRALGWICVRSVLLTVMWAFYYSALPYVPLSVAAAAYYTLPFFIVGFSALVGQETVGWPQWVGCILGFVGIVLVLRPGADAFSWAALLPITAAILYAGAMVLTRTTCRDEHPATLAIGLHISFIGFGVIGLCVGVYYPNVLDGFLTPVWFEMDGQTWGIFALLAAFILIASIGTAFAYQIAPASIIGTFDFAYVGFALLWGLVMFAERPDTIAVVGISLIVAAGVFALKRAG